MPEPTSVASAAAGSAMQRAVIAEQDARRAIAGAEAASAASLEAARAQARELLNAVPARIERLRARGARTAGKALQRIAAEEAAALQALGATAFPDELVEPVTDAVAAALTGGEPGAAA
jgi:hypothetical protein